MKKIRTSLLTAALGLAFAGSGEAALTMLPDPASSTHSSQFSAGFAGTFLYDGTVTLADVGGTANQGGQWAGAGGGPHVQVWDMGSATAFQGIFYAQRLGADPNTDKVTGIEFWVTNTDPGAASTTMPILSTTVDHNLTVTNTANNNLTEYDFGTGLSGQWVVMRFTGNGGNPGGSELVLGIPEPGSAALLGMAGFALTLRRRRR